MLAATGFRLVNAEVKDLTPEVAEQFRNLEASPTERSLDESRIKHLREKAEAGQLVTFNWSTAKFGARILRMNGQHSSNMLCSLNGDFPKNLKVHFDTYEVDSPESLAILFRQFDDRKSGRTPGDVSGAYQGLYNDLHEVPRASAKLAVEGVAYFRTKVEGLPDDAAPIGDASSRNNWQFHCIDHLGNQSHGAELRRDTVGHEHSAMTTGLDALGDDCVAAPLLQPDRLFHSRRRRQNFGTGRLRPA
jgi:hypothetical protein